MAYTSPYTGVVYDYTDSYYAGGRQYNDDGTYIELDSPANIEVDYKSTADANKVTNAYSSVPKDANLQVKNTSSNSDGEDKDRFDASSFAKSLGYSTTGAAKKALGVNSLEEYYKKMGDRLLEDRKRKQKQAEEIGKSWDPVLSELDRRLGELPTRRAEYEGRIGESTEAQLADVEASRSQSTEALQTEKARNLRDLEGDIRNQIEAAGRKIGVAGAGSSSAVGQASEAVARVGQKTRGDLMETVTQKLTEINNLATQERSKVNQWKQDKLFEITSYFGDKLDELKSQYANAQKERKRAVAELIYNAENEFVKSITSLDSEIMGYNQQIDMWERERAAELEDYNRTQGNAGSTNLSNAIEIFNLLLENGMSAEQAREELDARGIYVPTGISGEKEDDIDSIYGAYKTYTPDAQQQDPYGFLFSDLGSQPNQTTGMVF